MPFDFAQSERKLTTDINDINIFFTIFNIYIEKLKK